MKKPAFIAALCTLVCSLMAFSVSAAQSHTGSQTRTDSIAAQNLNHSQNLRVAYWDGRHKGYYTRSGWCRRNPQSCYRRWCNENPRACYQRWCRNNPYACRAQWCQNHPHRCRW